jgi:tetratricopeptide (TPR) repeat protein
MRARIEQRGGPGVWLATAIWLWAGQAAWGQVQPPPAVAPSSGGGSLGLKAGQEISSERIQELYRRILTDWSSGQVDRAPDELIELETAVVSDEEPKTRKRLFEAEQAVIHQVGANDLEVLVPIAVLHHEAYRRLIDGPVLGRALVINHTRKMARDLAVLYKQQAGTEGASLVASRVLTSLGGMLLRSAQYPSATDMLEEAIALDGRNVSAYLALSTIYEKNGQYKSTEGVLRQLLANDSAHAEGRLRLAVTLRRLDKPEDARKILEELVASPETSWVNALAFQDLALLESGQGKKTSAAEKVLRTAIERYPQDARLHIQLAAVLDRRGASAEAGALVEKALAFPAEGVSSARWLYNSARPDIFAEARSFLAENSRSRLPMLAQALGAPVAAATGVGR